MRQVLWDRSKFIRFSNVWARMNFDVKTDAKMHSVTVADKRSGNSVCECVGVGHSHGDPFQMQVIIAFEFFCFPFPRQLRSP